MSVRIRSGKFVVDYYPHGRSGKRVRLTLPENITDIDMAKEIERDLRNPVVHGEVAAVNATVNELFPKYIEYCHLHKSERTAKDVGMTFNVHIKNILGSYKVEEIGKEHTTIYKKIRNNEFIVDHKIRGKQFDSINNEHENTLETLIKKNKKIEKRPSNRTINKEMYYFMGFLKWCRKEHKINVGDFKYEPLEQRKHIPTVLSPKEAIDIINNTDNFHRVFFLVLYFLGLRFSEATALLIQDLDESNKTIVVREGKGGKERLLPIPGLLINEIKKIVGDRKTGLIFLSKKSASRVVDVRRAIKNARKEAKIEKAITPHSFRHTYATHLMGLGINIKIIQLLLGHARESTTADMYTHGTIEHMRSAQSTLEKQYKKILNK